MGHTPENNSQSSGLASNQGHRVFSTPLHLQVFAALSALQQTFYLLSASPPSCPAALAPWHWQPIVHAGPRTHLLALPAEQGAACADDLVAAIKLVNSLQAAADGQARRRMTRLIHPTTSPAHSCLMSGKAAASLLQTCSSCRGSTQPL